MRRQGTGARANEMVLPCYGARMNEISLVVGVVSGLAGIVGLLIARRATSDRWWHAAYIFAFALIVSFATYQSNKIARINDIASAADRLVRSKEMEYTHQGFVLAALSFLEKHKDVYPDTYARAQQMCESHKCTSPDPSEVVYLASSLAGLVRGLGTISQSK